MNLKNNIPHREFISEVQSRILWTASLMLPLGLFTTVEAADPTGDTKTLTAEELVILDSDGNRRIELKVEESGPTLYIRDSQGNNQIDIGIETLEDGREEPRLRVFDENGNIKVVVDRNSRYLFYGEDAPSQRRSLSSLISFVLVCFAVVMLAINGAQVLKRLKKLEAKNNEAVDAGSKT